jgi:polyhydroxyalkanoate synthesis regulator protein
MLARDGSTKMSETRDVQSSAVLIKRYAGRRLYDATDLTYVSHDLVEMILSHRRLVVRDAETGDDVTGEILDRLH